MYKKQIVLLMAMALLTIIVQSGVSNAQTPEFHMIVLDATGSMNVDFCLENENDRSSWKHRFWCAQKQAKSIVMSVSLSNTFYGLHIITGNGSSFIKFNGKYFTNDVDEIRAAIEAVQPTPFDTPMADSICRSIEVLKNESSIGDNLYLKIYTDGGENFSTRAVCGSYMSCANDIPFYLNAMVPYPSGIITDNIRGEWIPNGSVISHNGRAYSYDDDAIFDWSGGVFPGSWEWRVYYMTAWGDPRRGEDFFETHENYEWGPPASENNVIMDIEVFYDQIFPGDLRVADSIHKTASDDPRHLTYYPVTTDNGRSMMSTLDPVEDSLFDGLAALTKGRYIKVKKGEPLPILGDVNRDGKVNETDLRSVYTWFGRPVDYYNQGSVNADINLDAFVDNADMSYVRENWNDKTKPAPIHGDVDYNRCVDEADYKQVMQWYGKKVDPNSQHSYHADLNADGVIDYLDVNIIKNNMYKGCGNNDETCEDGIENGDETDIDCGGEDCEGCEIGQKCYDNEDCKSKNCKNGICVKNFIAELTAEVKVYTDWGNGYCANIEITNRNSYPTKTWTVGLNTNQSTIYTSWNGKYSGTFGEIKVEPADWNRVINPGQKIVSPGLCANKFFGGTAEVTFARGSY